MRSFWYWENQIEISQERHEEFGKAKKGMKWLEKGYQTARKTVPGYAVPGWFFGFCSLILRDRYRTWLMKKIGVPEMHRGEGPKNFFGAPKKKFFSHLGNGAKSDLQRGYFRIPRRISYPIGTL